MCHRVTGKDEWGSMKDCSDTVTLHIHCLLRDAFWIFRFLTAGYETTTSAALYALARVFTSPSKSPSQTKLHFTLTVWVRHHLQSTAALDFAISISREILIPLRSSCLPFPLRQLDVNTSVGRGDYTPVVTRLQRFKLNCLLAGVWSHEVFSAVLVTCFVVGATVVAMLVAFHQRPSSLRYDSTPTLFPLLLSQCPRAISLWTLLPPTLPQY